MGNVEISSVFQYVWKKLSLFSDLAPLKCLYSPSFLVFFIQFFPTAPCVPMVFFSLFFLLCPRAPLCSVSTYYRSCRVFLLHCPILDFDQESVTALNMTTAQKAAPSISPSNTPTGTQLSVAAEVSTLLWEIMFPVCRGWQATSIQVSGGEKACVSVCVGRPR